MVDKITNMEYHPILTIPQYLVQGITDEGADRWYNEDGKVENDDLRIAIKLPAGHTLLVPTRGRIVIDNDGDLTIEVPMDVTPRKPDLAVA